MVRKWSGDSERARTVRQDGGWAIQSKAGKAGHSTRNETRGRQPDSTAAADGGSMYVAGDVVSVLRLFWMGVWIRCPRPANPANEWRGLFSCCSTLAR